jgi:hypothetical protein
VNRWPGDPLRTGQPFPFSYLVKTSSGLSQIGVGPKLPRVSYGGMVRKRIWRPRQDSNLQPTA